jgi:hypothetical protein
MFDQERIDSGSAEAAAEVPEPEMLANSTATSAPDGLFAEPPLSSEKRDRLRGGIVWRHPAGGLLGPCPAQVL